MTDTVAFIRSYYTAAGRQALWNLGWVVALTSLGQLIATVIAVILTRNLGQDKFGVIAFAMTLHTYLVLVGSFGSSAIMIREVAKKPQRLNAIATSYLLLTASASTVVFGLTTLGILLAPIASSERVLLLFLAAGVIPASTNLGPLFIVVHAQATNSFAVFLAECSSLIAVFALQNMNLLTTHAVGAIIAAKWLLIVALQWTVCSAAMPHVRWNYDVNTLRAMAKASWPLMIVNLVSYIPLTSGIFFLRLLDSKGSAAIYSLGCQVAVAYFSLASLCVQIVQPHINGPHGLQRSFIRKLVGFLFLFAGVLALLASAGGFILFYFIFDVTYRQSAIPMILLIPAAAGMLASSILSLYLIRLHDRLFVPIQLVPPLLYVAGCLLFHKHMNPPVAATLAIVAVIAGVMLSLSRVKTVIDSEHVPCISGRK